MGETLLRIVDLLSFVRKLSKPIFSIITRLRPRKKNAVFCFLKETVTDEAGDSIFRAGIGFVGYHFGTANFRKK
jgi:hypothetical protein